MSQLVVIWNSGSGKANGIEQVRDLLADRDVDWLDLSNTDDFAGDLQSRMKADCQTVVVAGGDGTVNAAVNAIMTLDSLRRPNVAIIPLGTANDFAGTLGISDDPASAIQLIDQPAVGIDLVKISGEGCDRYYANIAAGGNCVRVSEAMTDEVKARWGALSYMRGAVEVLPDMKTYRVQVRCDDETMSDLDLWAVLIANGKTNAGGIEVAPKASTSDGNFDVILIRDGDVGDMVEIVANNLLGNFLESDQVIFRQARSLHIQSDPPMRFTIDGEVIDEEPVRFEVYPSAISIHTQES